MQNIIFLSLFLVAPGILFSQPVHTVHFQHEADSLRKLIPGSGTEKQVDILNELAGFYAPVNFDSSVYYSSRAALLATNSGYDKGIGMARYQAGNAYYYRLDLKNAMISYLSARSIYEKEGMNIELGDLNMMLGNIHYFVVRGDNALACYRNALAHYQASGNKSRLFDVYDAMSMTLMFIKGSQADSMLAYGFRMLEEARKSGNSYREAYALMQIAGFYCLSDHPLEEKQKSLIYCDSALTRAQALKENNLVAIVHIVYGNYHDWRSPGYEMTGDLAAARSGYDKAYRAARESGCSYLQAAILNYLASIDLEEKKFSLAEMHLDACEASLRDFFDRQWKVTPAGGYFVCALGKLQDYFMAQRERMNMFHYKSRLAMAVGKPAEAVGFLKLNFKYRDTLFAYQSGQQLELLMAEDEADRQQQRMETLARDNELSRLKLSRSRLIFIGSGAGILLISVILLLFFQRRKLRAEQRSVSMEQRLLRAQMNPHFIFNSLASIQNFVINENSDQASIYLSRFSQLVRNILDSSTEEYVPLEKEISTVENYLELQKVRYAGKFDYRITVDERIDPENMQIPPMLAQPFIENAIEHGIRHRETTGHIEVIFRLEDGMVRFIVEDDGVGREKAQEIESRQTSRHRSMATSITRDRLDILNKKLSKKIRMEITDLKDASGRGCGTRVEFGIPLMLM